MILASNIVDNLKAQLDSSDSNRYTFDRDYKPAINQAIEWVVTLFNAAFGEKKVSEEVLRELIITRIYVCNKFSRLSLFDTAILKAIKYDTNYIWSILGVFPKCKVVDVSGNVQGDPAVETDPFKSFRTEFVMVPDSGNKATERLTIEEWEDVENNIFARGNPNVTNGYASFSYKNWNTNKPIDSTLNLKTQSLSSGPEIEIKPQLSNKFIGIEYLQFPTNITLITDELEFPAILTNMISQKSLDFVTKKNYDRNPLYQVTAAEINNLATLLS